MRCTFVHCSRLLLVAASVVPACRPPAAQPAVRAYPCILHSPDQLGPDFSVRQRVEATSGDRTGAFDGVLQKVGSELVIVGLGPAGVRAFVLKQAADRVTFGQTFGPELPFPPRYILIDVHRAFFKRLPPPASGSGTSSGRVDDEEVEEDWLDGHLAERRFSRPGSALEGLVRVTYARGCTVARCAPASFRLVNQWFSYSLTVSNADYTWL